MSFLEENINKIICDDCLNVLKKLPDKCVDLTLTDPPYGIGDKFTSKFGMQVVKQDKNNFDWNNDIPSKEIFDEMFRVSKNLIIFGGNYYTNYLWPTNAWIVWDKKGNTKVKNPFSDCELAWTIFHFAMRKITVVNMGFISQKEEKGKRIHPTQKPLKLIEKLIQDYSKPGEIVADWFSGSATTAIACHNLKRRFVCVENNVDYWAASVERMKNHKLQASIFDFVPLPEQAKCKQSEMFEVLG